MARGAGAQGALGFQPVTWGRGAWGGLQGSKIFTKSASKIYFCRLVATRQRPTIHHTSNVIGAVNAELHSKLFEVIVDRKMYFTMVYLSSIVLPGLYGESKQKAKVKNPTTRSGRR